MRDDAIVFEDNSALAGADMNELLDRRFRAECMARGFEALSEVRR